MDIKRTGVIYKRIITIRKTNLGPFYNNFLQSDTFIDIRIILLKIKRWQFYLKSSGNMFDTINKRLTFVS